MITKNQIQSYNRLLDISNIDLTSFSNKDADIDTYKEYVKNEVGQYSNYDSITDYNNRMKQQLREIKYKLKQLKNIKSNRLRHYLKNHIKEIENILRWENEHKWTKPAICGSS